MISRRVFLKDGGLAMVSLGFAPAFVARAAAAAPGRRKVLVAVFQRGAVDGLNMVVPFGEAAYYTARPSIAVAAPGRPDGAIDLDGFFGLHPRMAALAPLFARGELAVVHASGSPHDTRSHFDAQDYMESGTPGVKRTRDGWLNRYLHAREHREASPFRAVAVAPALPRLLQGQAPALAVGRLERFGIQSAGDTPVAASFEAQYAETADALLRPTAGQAFDAVRLLNEARRSQPSRADAAYPRSAFGDAMRQIAWLIRADLGLEVAFAELGQWDHHANEGGATGQLAGRLDDFATGLAAFCTDLGDRMAEVVIVTMSEFGRTVRENGNRGTDHGHGNAMLVVGGSVQGGKVYGRWPGLARDALWQGRDLAVTTDFRDVFGEVVAGHLGAADVSAVFPDHRRGEPLGLLRT